MHTAQLQLRVSAASLCLPKPLPPPAPQVRLAHVNSQVGCGPGIHIINPQNRLRKYWGARMLTCATREAHETAAHMIVVVTVDIAAGTGDKVSLGTSQ